MEYDLIVIGSGSVGSATGYYASKSGLKVLMIDNGTPPHQNGSHHGATRITRTAYGEGSMYVPLCIRAKALWNELEATSGEQLLISCGVLNTGPEESGLMRNIKITCEEFDLNVENLTSDEINTRWNCLHVPDEYIGVLETDAGYLKSELAVATFVKLSKEAGAEHLFNCNVESVKPTENGVEVHTNRGKFVSKKAVVSAGTWVKKLLPKIPIAPVRKIFTVNKTEGNRDDLPVTMAVLKNYSYYTIPDADGYKVGQHDGGQVIEKMADLAPFGSLDEDLSETVDFLKQFFPNVGEIVRGVVCSYDMTPDKHFIIDTLPESDNVLIITGLSGHGFKFSTVLAEIGAMFARGEKPTIDITPFTLKRFD